MSKSKILVLGTSDEAVAIAGAVIENAKIPYEVVGFLTKKYKADNIKLLGKDIFTDIDIKNSDKQTFGVDGVLMIKEVLTKEEIEYWVNLLIEKNIRIYKSPNIQKLREGDSKQAFHNLKIEDLLSRKPISIENEEVRNLHLGKSILVTGGYIPNDYIKSLADSKNLPLIITPHDTFSVTHLINRVTNDQIIKRDIITVESIYIKVENLYIINLNNTVKDWYNLQLEAGHTRYPVVNEYGKLVGIITARDVFLKDKDALIKEVMERKVSTTTLDTPISSVANTMLLEGFELMPVIDAKNTLLGVVTRKLVINSLLTSNRFQEGHNNDTFDEIMRKGIVPRADGLQVKIIPQMLDQFGTFSSSALLSIIDESIHITSYNYNRSEVLMQNVSLYFLKSVPLDRTVTTKVNILDIGRKTAKFDVEVFDKTELVAKAMVTCQVFQRN